MTSTRPPHNRSLGLAIVTAAAVAAICIVGFVVLDDDPDTEPASSPTSNPQLTAPPAPSPTTAAAGTPTQPDDVDASWAVWPWQASDIRYDNPIAAARGFAIDFAGFIDPVIGQFRHGDARSGQVDVRPTSTGPVTTVQVRRLQDNTWWVLASVTENIRLDSPTAGERVSSPARLLGAANTYEGHVDVFIQQDGSHQPIGQHYVTGCQGDMCPFDGQIAFTPAHTSGAIVLSTTGGEPDQVWEIAVTRVSLG